LVKEMLINIAQEEERRIAIVEDGKLEELYIERASEISHVGNIYKGRVINVEPSIQACFVDFGIGQNGFLHISDLHPSYFYGKNAPRERVGHKRPRRDRPLIQDCLKRGQEILIQVIKEGIGTKGPTLTTYLSIPSRYLVLMPGMNRMGISRKIEDLKIRDRIRELLNELNPPKDLGFIIRTAGMDRSKRDLQRDLNYLLRLWQTVSKKIKSESAPAPLYQESDLITRTIRDIYNADINRIICDSEITVKKVRDFLRIVMPRSRSNVNLDKSGEPLFSKYHLEEEIEKIQTRHVPLKSGGSLVIDTTEAIVAIDVNSGKFRIHGDAETTAFKINMEAAPEIARQLRLRDLGGVIIIDFVDMMNAKHRAGVEKALRQAVSTDRARTKILRISQFGIVEMTRQRMRPSLERSTYMDCPHCKGTGLIKTAENMSIAIMRRIQSIIEKQNIANITIEVSDEVASFLLNRKRGNLSIVEKATGKTILVEANHNFSNDEIKLTARDNRGSTTNCAF